MEERSRLWDPTTRRDLGRFRLQPGKFSTGNEPINSRSLFLSSSFNTFPFVWADICRSFFFHHLGGGGSARKRLFETAEVYGRWGGRRHCVALSGSNACSFSACFARTNEIQTSKIPVIPAPLCALMPSKFRSTEMSLGGSVFIIGARLENKAFVWPGMSHRDQRSLLQWSSGKEWQQHEVST